MDRLTKVLDVTKQLEQLLSVQVSGKNRESIITELNELVAKRGQLLQQVTPPFTDQEKMIGKEVVALNKKIQKKMNEIFHELKQEMKRINQQKKSTNTYENPYKSMPTLDGMFLDQKK